jgi:hypothetical protein
MWWKCCGLLIYCSHYYGLDSTSAVRMIPLILTAAFGLNCGAETLIATSPVRHAHGALYQCTVARVA